MTILIGIGVSSNDDDVDLGEDYLDNVDDDDDNNDLCISYCFFLLFQEQLSELGAPETKASKAFFSFESSIRPGRLTRNIMEPKNGSLGRVTIEINKDLAVFFLASL